LAKLDEISVEELEQSLKSMKNRKAASPDGLNFELFKFRGPVISNRLLKLERKIDPRRVGTCKCKIPIQKKANMIIVQIIELSSSL
jgi:hypothetical protein